MTSLAKVPPTQPLRTWIRSTGNRLRPRRLESYLPANTPATDAALAAGAGLHRRAEFVREIRPGACPTIVLGGFVPDATEQVYILRGFFLRRGSLYYVNLSREGFSLDLLCAQLDDLVEELQRQHGVPPAVFAVSFGAGLVLEWLRRCRLRGREPQLQGLTFISPVACTADLLSPSEPKPSTLLGRALQPFLGEKPATEAQVEKARTIFLKMFEAGAQNRSALGTLISRGELEHLHREVLSTIRGVASSGARERISALNQLADLTRLFGPDQLPLHEAPTLILYAEKEDNVLVPSSPTRFALSRATRAYFPNGDCRVVKSLWGSAVQHASLVFHAYCFLPYLSRHYARFGRPLRERLAA